VMRQKEAKAVCRHVFSAGSDGKETTGNAETTWLVTTSLCSLRILRLIIFEVSFLLHYKRIFTFYLYVRLCFSSKCLLSANTHVVCR
jgi:hypothetical protein